MSELNACQNTECAECGGRCFAFVKAGNNLCYACRWSLAAKAKPTPQRESWDDYFFGIARKVATRATCPRASIGVVLVDANHRIVSTGYNGAPAGASHCIDVGCDMFADHCVRSTHAEINALRQIEDRYVWSEVTLAYERLSGATTAYIVGPRPVCSNCARAMKDAGVAEVKWKEI